MFKYVACILLSFCYLLSANGATVYLHFCQGKAQKISMNQNMDIEKDCKICIDHDQHDCAAKNSSCDTKKNDCQDVSVKIKKLENNYFSGNHIDFQAIQPLIICLSWLTDYFSFLEMNDNRLFGIYLKHIPIPDPEVIHIKNQNFRI